MRAPARALVTTAVECPASSRSGVEGDAEPASRDLLVDQDVDAIAHGRSLGEAQALRDARFGEEPLPGTDYHRVDLEVDCIDEVVLEQGLRELRAACTTMSPLHFSLNFVTSSTTSPRSTVVLVHSGFSRVEEITYSGIELNLSANSPSWLGQTGAKPS